MRGKADDLCAIRQQRRCSPQWWRARSEANTSIEYVATMGSTIEQRLEAIASVLLRRILSPESIGLMCAVVAEARRFPDLADQRQTAGARSLDRVGGLPLGEVAQSGEMGVWPAFAPDRLSGTARRFMDVIVLSMAMWRALFGEDLRPVARRDRIARWRKRLGSFSQRADTVWLASDGSGQLTVTKRAER